MDRFILIVLCLIASMQMKAQQSAEELAKKPANPISSLISVPFQNNSDYGIGERNGSRNTMNIQPVVPIALSDKLNLIARWVQPWITNEYSFAVCRPAGCRDSTFEII